MKIILMVFILIFAEGCFEGKKLKGPTSTQGLKLIQDVNLPMLQSRIDKWIQSESNNNINIYYANITSTTTRQEEDFATVTVLISYGTN